MVRAKKAIAAALSPESIRTGAKTSKQTALHSAAKNKRVTKQKATPNAPSPAHISPQPESHHQSPSSRASIPSELTVDVSHMRYELHISCSVDRIPIITRAEHRSLRDFKLQPFLDETRKMIAQRTHRQAEMVSLLTGWAELRHGGLERDVCSFPKNNFDYREYWEEVEKVLEAWMTKNLLDIRVDLIIHFYIVEKEIQPAQNAASSSDTEDIAMPAPHGNRGVRLLENVAKNSAKQSPESV
jgi:hypothetical protein